MASRRQRTALIVAAVGLVSFAAGVGVGRLTDRTESTTGPTTTGSTATSGSTAAGETTTTIPTTAAVQTANGYTWRPVRIGGGGNISGIGAADDGTLVARNDVYGAYIRPAGAGEWRQLLTTGAVPAEFHQPKMGKGVQEIAVAPSDAQRVYLMWAGHLLSSTDGGTTFVTTAFTPANWDSNGSFGKGFGDKMAVDPANPDVVLAAGPDTPLRRSTDGGATWTDTTVPAGLAQKKTDEDYAGQIKSVGITGIEFDRTQGTADGHTNVVYAASWGNGVYRSADGGATWTAIAGPTFVEHATIDPNGAYYAVAGDIQGPFSVQRYDATGVWKEIAPGTWDPQGIAGVENPFIAADPSNPGTVVLGYAKQLYVSRTSGDSWKPMHWSDGTGDVTWAQNGAKDYYLVASDLIFDPVHPGRLWLSTGEGSQWADLSAGSESITWIEASKGFETMVATDVESMRNGPPVFGVYDFGQFSGSSNLDDSSLVKGPVPFFSGTTSVAVSPFADDFAASVTTDYVNGDGDYPISSSYTDDGGKSWHRFESMPKGATSARNFGFGVIAVSQPDNMVWAPGRYNVTETDEFQPYYTKDRGKTWKPVVLPGVTRYPADSISGYMFGKNRQVLVADEVKPGVFYLFMQAEGLFRSTDGGDTWERMHQGNVSLGSPDFGSELGALPGREGELFFTDGASGGHNFLGPQEHGGWPFMHSTDGGATWAPVDGVDKVLSFGFGAPAPGSDVGSIYLAGNVNDTYGIWQSTDGAATWRQIGDYPYTVDWAGPISGDRNTFGTVYLGFGGSTYVYGVPVG